MRSIGTQERFANVKRLAAGREVEILTAVGGIPSEILDGKHHPCPKCGGKDRARYDLDEHFFYCNRCFDKNNGDFIAAVAWATGWNQVRALVEVEKYLGSGGVSGGGNGHYHATTNGDGKKVYRTSADALAAYKHYLGEPSTWFEYTDGSGVCVGIVYRWDTASGKEIRPVSRVADGWICGGMPEPRPVYQQQDVVKASTVYLDEGEKAVNASRDIGLTATTSANGAKSPHKTDWSPLAGKEVIIRPDNDADGEKYAKAVAGLLAKLDPAPVVKILRLPDLPPKGDAYDYIAKRKSEGATVDEIRNEIVHMAQYAEVVEADAEAANEKEAEPWPSREYTATDLATLDFSITWLCDQVLVALQPAIAGGGWKCLKTSVLIDLFVSLASGTDFLNRFRVPCPVRVGYISAESGMNTNQETFIRICKAKGIDPGSLTDQFIMTDDSHDFTTAAGIAALVAWCKRRQFVAVGVDPAYLNFAGLAETSANVFAVGAALRTFSRALLSEGITPTVAHHSIKVPLDRYAPLDLAALSGSGWAEFARQWILLSRRREYVDGSGFHELHCRIGGSAGHSSLWHLDVDEGPSDQTGPRKWRIGLTEAGQAKRDAKRAKDEAFGMDVQGKAEMIVKHLEQRPGMADTETGICKLGIGRTKAALQALQSLVDSGRIAFSDDCVCKPGRTSGRPGYRLLPEDTDDENT